MGDNTAKKSDLMPNRPKEQPYRRARKLPRPEESEGFLPTLPDYFGYFLAFLVIWLIYTGISSSAELLSGLVGSTVATVHDVTEGVKASVLGRRKLSEEPKAESTADEKEGETSAHKKPSKVQKSGLHKVFRHSLRREKTAFVSYAESVTSFFSSDKEHSFEPENPS